MSCSADSSHLCLSETRRRLEGLSFPLGRQTKDGPRGPHAAGEVPRPGSRAAPQLQLTGLYRSASACCSTDQNNQRCTRMIFKMISMTCVRV